MSAAGAPGARVLYLPPTTGQRRRTGTLHTTSGASALVLFDDDKWPQWAPLERLLPIADDIDGWAQLLLLPQEKG